MIAVAGIWEQGWNTPILEYDLWDFPLKDFGVDKFIMSPISGISKKVFEYNNVDDIIKDHEDLTIVYVDERGEVPLPEFKHPENCLYLTGRTSRSVMDKTQLSVRIPTLLDKSFLWAHQAVVLVLYDRMLKNGNYSNR